MPAALAGHARRPARPVLVSSDDCAAFREDFESRAAWGPHIEYLGRDGVNQVAFDDSWFTPEYIADDGKLRRRSQGASADVRAFRPHPCSQTLERFHTFGGRQTVHSMKGFLPEPGSLALHRQRREAKGSVQEERENENSDSWRNMVQIKTFRTIATAALISLALLGAPSAAEASIPNEDSADHSVSEGDLRAFLGKYDVQKSTQDKLMKKLETGQTWDSMEQGSSPTEVEEKTVGRTVETVNRFNDGSVTVTTAPDFEGDVERARQGSTAQLDAQAVKSCSFKKAGSYGGYWTNCKATQNNGTIGLSFRFNYQNIKGKGSKITKYGNGDYHLFGGTISGLKFKKTSSKTVRYSGHAKASLNGVTILNKSIYLQVKVSGNTAKTTHRF